MPPWQIALSILMAVVVMSLCLFPLAPYRLRITVVYFFLALLCGIFALILFRLVLFMIVFTVTGAHLQLHTLKHSFAIFPLLHNFLDELYYNAWWRIGNSEISPPLNTPTLFAW
jgi:hypothetical protein